VLVLGDMIAAAADDLGVPLGSRDVRRLAPHIVELLELAGYCIVENPAGC
jgi:hypothetical protein